MRKENTCYHRILVVKFRYHGDMLLTTPLISTLKKWYPDAKVDVLLYQDTLPILVENPEVNAFYTLPRKTNKGSEKISQAFRLTRQLRRNNYDLVINLADKWPVAVMTSFIRGHKIGLNRGDTLKGKIWSLFFDETLKPDTSKHIVLQNLDMLSTLKGRGIEPETALSMHYNAADAKILSEVPQSVLNKYIVIQPTTRQAYKYWDNEKFAAVIDHFKIKGYEVILTCGPDHHELSVVKDIYQLCRLKPNKTLAGKTTFSQLAALIDHARLYIGLDSAPMHMAAALNTPVIAMFGPTDYKVWRPWTQHFRQIWAGAYCKMPENADYDKTIKYLSCIPADDIIKAAENILDETQGEDRGNRVLPV